ncbi:HD domain-containing protein [bacterium]|nr:HD domain-containing protein [bacterium]
MPIAAIHQLVHDLCNSLDNLLTASFFNDHLSIVAHYALLLAAPLHADPELLEIASYLHDISAVRDFNTLPTHAADSAIQAGQILSDLGYPADKIAIIQNAIELHAQPLKSGSPEAVALSNADAIAQISNPSYWLFFAFKIRNLDYAVGRQWYATRIQQNWSALIPEAQDLIEQKYTSELALFDI